MIRIKLSMGRRGDTYMLSLWGVHTTLVVYPLKIIAENHFTSDPGLFFT